jgi:hypothetical protein
MTNLLITANGKKTEHIEPKILRDKACKWKEW